ncbi:hypothetical protein HX836_31705 [Pseudomonas yamanorum]|uniref:hypothetical protein n=1 Tax=Pseudomonas yamanorum TaxID=515393 RepID=UPI0015A0B452|nr:hypothetical protein [Pseudomonas yamanorum]NVZ86396.1 hypothetical protein [Pseudomonas yamanorum]
MSPKVWELSSFSEAAMASVQPTWMLPDPPLSQPRRGSTAPTFDLHALSEGRAGMSSEAERDLTGHEDPVWELSSFSEAAMASEQPTWMLPDPPLSQPRRGSTAPTFDLHVLSECRAGMSPKTQRDLISHEDPVWELSSFSEAAMASVQPTWMLPDPPLSQPRLGSTAPTFDLHALSECGAGMSPKTQRDLISHEDPVWELSSFSEAAMASVQPTSIFNLHALSECGVGMTMEKKNR